MTTTIAQSKISVIIPCYNARSYIGEAISSIFAQNHSNIELIVIDDGSTDDSASVIKAFGHVIYRQQENQGISAARNAGIAIATGELLAFLDADDLWPAESLALRLRMMQDDPKVDAAYGATEQFISPDLDPDTARTIHCPAQPIVARIAGALLIKRDAMTNTGPFNGSFQVGETMEWVARSEAAGVKYASTDAVVLRRRIHGNNTVLNQRHQQSDYLKALHAAIKRRRSASKTGAPAAVREGTGR